MAATQPVSPGGVENHKSEDEEREGESIRLDKSYLAADEMEDPGHEEEVPEGNRARE